MLKKILFIVLIIQSAIINNVLASGNPDYLKGWEAFNKNDRTEAHRLFNLAANDSESKHDALLSLSLLDCNEHKMDAAFNDYRQSYQVSSNPYPYLYALSSQPFIRNSNQLMSQDKLGFFEKMVTDSKMNGTLKAMISQMIGMYYFDCNNPAKAKEWYARIGAISNWQVLGAFDNTSGSGFSKDWGVVSKPLSTDVFKNKVGADIQWFTPTCNDPKNWFRFDYCFALDNNIMYAQSFVESPAEQEAFLRVGTSGSLKIWINDALVASVPEERNCDLDIYAYKVKLNQGNNRILVQIGQNEIDQANFMIRLTDADANPIPSLKNSAIYATYVKSDKQNSTDILPFFAEEYFSAKVREDSINPLYPILLSEIYLRNDKVYEATRILKDLEAKYPKSTLISDRLIEAYNRAQNQTDYDLENEKIKRVDPESFNALQLLYNEAVKTEKYTEAVSISQKAREIYGSNPETDEWDLCNEAYLKRIPETKALSKTLSIKYPDSYEYVNVNYQLEKQSNPKSAIPILEDFCKKYMNASAMELLSKAYIEQGNNEKGLEVLKKRIETEPYAIGYIDNLTSVLFEMQKYKEALKYSDQVLALSPYLSGAYNTRGYIYKNMKDEVNAIDCFKKAIYLNPVSYDSRTQLRLLEKKKELSEYFPKIDLKELIAKAPTAAENSQDNSIVLLSDNKLIVYPEGAKEYHNELAAKILNQSGIENWKEYNIGYNSNSQKLIIDKAEVIKSNGNIVKAETNDDNYVVFTNLEVNDVLHLVYRIQDMSKGKLAKHFFNSNLFQHGSPFMKNRYCILLPKDMKFQYMFKNGEIKPTITDVEDMKLYQWESDNQPAIKDEPYMSAYVDVASTLYYSSIPDWRELSNWYKDLTSNKFKSDYVLKETVSNLLKGKENASSFEKARIFYNYILENISYSNVSFLHGNFVPQKASRTITTRLGDCKDVSTLFVALCREVGINANLVLISTRNYGNKTMPLPAIDFNHCIAQLNLNNKVYYLELTDQTLPFGAALVSDIHSEILPIPFSDEPFGDHLLTMDAPTRPLNRIKRNIQVTFSKNDLLIDHTSVYFAANASEIRNKYKNIGSEEQLKTFNQSVASNFSIPVKLTNLNFFNLDNLEDSVVVSYKLGLTNALQDVAGMKIMKLPWTDNISALDIVTTETRTYPLELWAYMDHDVATEEINMSLPAGKKFVEMPKDVVLECANATYRLTFNTKIPGKLNVKRSIHRKTEQVLPQEYAAFRAFINQVSESDNKQYAIQ